MSSNILFIGRFQPFHLGHLWVIKRAIQKSNHLFIGIGSAQYSHTPENPFTLGERIVMIHAALKETKIDSKKYKIIPIPDIHNDAVWPAHVRRLVAQEFDAVWTGRPLVKKLFRKYDHVEIINLIRWKRISATQVRSNMRKNGRTWQKWVPKTVAKMLEGLNAIERVKNPKLPFRSTHKSSSTAGATN